MLYINDQKTKATAKTYKELVNLAIRAGIEPQRAYMYLASIGVRGELVRILNDDGVSYGRPVKMAFLGDGGLVTDVRICKSCGSLQLSK